MNEPATTNPTASPKTSKSGERGVILISYPKIVFLWPSWLVALVAGIWMRSTGDVPSSTSDILTWTFLVVLGLNLVIFSFDFPRSTSLLLFFVIVAIVLGLILAAYNMPTLIPNLHAWLRSMHPAANSTFFLLFGSTLTLIYLAVLLTVRLDYWEVRPNELLHHHGIMSDLERFSSPNLRIDKEINDVFEFLLAGSGRLILHPRNEPRAIVLDNVFFINKKEAALTKLLGALQVQVRQNS